MKSYGLTPLLAWYSALGVLVQIVRRVGGYPLVLPVLVASGQGLSAIPERVESAIEQLAGHRGPIVPEFVAADQLADGVIKAHFPRTFGWGCTRELFSERRSSSCRLRKAPHALAGTFEMLPSANRTGRPPKKFRLPFQ
jgi:hypothetical protein